MLSKTTVSLISHKKWFLTSPQFRVFQPVTCAVLGLWDFVRNFEDDQRPRIGQIDLRIGVGAWVRRSINNDDKKN
jgi:hypothetical protein